MNKIFKHQYAFYLLAIILSSYFISFAQNPPCRESTVRLTFKTNNLDHVLPLSLDMPEDVIRSYLWIDSMCKNSNYNYYKNFIKSSNLFDDSLKQIIKYFYQFWDYDQIRAKLTSIYSDYNPSHIEPTKPPIQISNLDFLLSDRLKELNGPPFDILSLMKSGLIVHIMVDSTIKRYLSEVDRDELIVSCTIIDTIKGKVIPTFKNTDIVDSKNYNDPIPRTQKALPGSKFQFSYWLDQLRYCPDSRPLFDSAGIPWTTSGNEYIVFLFPIGVCGDSTDIYYTLWPFMGIGSCVYNMFPIKNGLIYNPLNEFGIPDQSSVISFKKRIRDLINDILLKRTLNLTDVENEENSINQVFTIFPNPAEDFIVISVGSQHTVTNTDIRIFNVFGETVKNPTQTLPEGEGLRIDVSGLPSGVYFVRVGNKVGKFVKI